MRLGAAEIGGADLHARRAEREGCGDTAGIGNAAGGNHRDLHGVGDLRNEREGAHLRGDIGLEEHAAMTAGFGALGDDGVDAALGEPDCFLDARGGAQDLAAGRFDALEECRRRQAEMKAHDRRPQLLDQRAGLLAEGLQPCLQRERRRCGAERRVVGRKAREPGLLARYILGRRRVAEEVQIDRLVALRPELGDAGADLVGAEHGARQRAEPSGLRYRDRHLHAGGVRHRRLHDGKLDAEQIEQARIRPHGSPDSVVTACACRAASGAAR